MSEQKFCVNCKWHKFYGYSPGPLCVHPETPRSVVDGSPTFCATERVHGECGIEGKKFEPVPPTPSAPPRHWYLRWLP